MWAVPRRTGIRTCRSLAGFHIPGGSATWLTMHDKHVRKYDKLALDFWGAVYLVVHRFGRFRVAFLCYFYSSGTQGIGAMPYQHTAAQIWPVRPPFVVAAFWWQICHKNLWRICHENWPHLVMTDLSKNSLTDTSYDFLWQIFTNFLWHICQENFYDRSVISFPSRIMTDPS